MAKVVDINVIEQLVKASGIKADKIEALMTSLQENAKESGFGVSANPPKEIDGVMQYFCRFTRQYYPAELMVFSGGKSKGYSKAAISVWNKINAEIKRLNADVCAYVLKEEPVPEELKANLDKLKAALNLPSTYNDLENALSNLGIQPRAQKKS